MSDRAREKCPDCFSKSKHVRGVVDNDEGDMTCNVKSCQNAWHEAGAAPSLDTGQDLKEVMQTENGNGINIGSADGKLGTKSASATSASLKTPGLADAARVGEIRADKAVSVESIAKVIYENAFDCHWEGIGGGTAERACWIGVAEAVVCHLPDIPYLLAEVERREKQWCEWGVVEVAVRNPQVADFCAHWEKRTELAETTASNGLDEIRRLVAEVERLRGERERLLQADVKRAQDISRLTIERDQARAEPEANY